MRALSAVDIALWDRNARSVNLPLWRYLGAYQSEDVPAYASGGYYHNGSPDEVIIEMESHVAAGFKAAKMKIGAATPEVDRQRVAAARSVLGDEGILLLDANNAWKDLPSALRALEPLMEYRPYFIEEPFGPEDLVNHRRLAERLPVAIATGEIVGGRWAHRDLIEHGGVTVLQADAAVCGGITEWRRVAGMAASASVPMAPHSFHDLHIHLVASVPNGIFVEFFRDDAVLPFRNVLDRQIETRDGKLVLPTDPGLGFEFNDEALKKFAVNAWE
jgi:L-alanine-DL-glutamate epimerase-like enolase superfamily enzyme